MKRKLMTLAICLFTSTTLMHAQSFLSQNHAIKRVITSDKYVLLPVEEDENNAHIRVIKDNQVVKEFNCKLAINGTIIGMQIFVDRCSIEAFDIDGKVAMSNLVFPSKPYDKIVAKGCKVKIHALKD